MVECYSSVFVICASFCVKSLISFVRKNDKLLQCNIDGMSSDLFGLIIII